MAEYNLGTARGRIELDSSGAKRGANEAEKATSGFMGTLEKNSRTLDRTGKALTGVGLAAVGGLGLAVKTAAGFEQTMNRVGAVSGATGDEFDSLRDKAKELGSTTAFSASEAAEGMTFLAMAGFDTNEVLEAMPGTLDLAAAGQLDLATAADIASNVLTGFGLEANEITRVNDAMAQTASSANTDIQQLGQAMSFVAPVANASGISIEEASAAIGKLSDAGIQGGRAGTTLRQVIARLESQTPKATKALERLGIQTHDSEGNLRSITDIVEQFEKAGLSTADAMEIFGTRAGPGMQALVDQGSESLRELGSEIENSGGRAKEMADRQLEGLNGAMTIMKSAVEGAMIAIGENLLPVLTRFAENVSGLIQRFAQMNPTVIKFITIGTALFGVLSILGGVMLMILARLPMMVQGIRLVGQAMTALHAGPIFLIIAALAALAAGIIYLWKNNERFREIVLAVWAKIQEVMTDAAKSIKGVFNTIKKAIQVLLDGWNGFGQGWASTSDSWLANVHKAGQLIRKIIDGIRSFIQMVLAKIQGFWERNGENIMKIVSGVFTAIKTTIEVVLGVIFVVIKTVLNLIQAFWDRFGHTIMTYVKNTFQNIRQIIEGVLDVIMGVVQFFISLFTGDWSGMADAIRRIWSGLWSIVSGVVQQAINTIAAIISGAVNAIIGLWNTLRDRSKSAWRSLVNGVKSLVRSLIDYVKRIPGRITRAFSRLPGQMKDVGKDIIQGMIDGVTNMAGNAVKAAKEVASNVKDQVTGFFKIGSPSKEMHDVGEDVIGGLARGIIQMKNEVGRAALAAAQAGLVGMEPLTDARLEPQVDGSGGGTTMTDMRQSTTTYQFSGDIVLPNVTDRSSADEILEGLRQSVRKGA